MIDSLLQKIKIQKEDSNKVKSLNRISYKFRENDNKKALEFGQEAYNLATKLKYTEGIWYACNNIAIAEKFLGKIEEAIKWNQKALDFAEKNNMSVEKGHSYNNLALLMSRSENYKKAEEYYALSLAEYKKVNYIEGYFSIYNNTGGLFYNQEEYIKAYRNFKEGYRVASEQKDSANIAQILNNLGNVLYYLDKKDSSYLCYEKSFFIAKRHASKREIVNSGANYAYMLYEAKNFDKSEKLYFELLIIANELNDKYEKSSVFSYLSTLYFDWGKYKLAYLYKDSAQKIDKELLSQENIKSINNLTALYENEKKELQISNLSKDNEVKGEKIKRGNIYKIVFAFGFIFIAVFAIYLIYSLRQKEKARKLIDIQKAIVEEKQKEILDSIHYAKRIQQAILPNEKFIEKQLNKKNKL